MEALFLRSAVIIRDAGEACSQVGKAGAASLRSPLPCGLKYLQSVSELRCQPGPPRAVLDLQGLRSAPAPLPGPVLLAGDSKRSGFAVEEPTQRICYQKAFSQSESFPLLLSLISQRGRWPSPETSRPLPGVVGLTGSRKLQSVSPGVPYL